MTINPSLSCVRIFTLALLLPPLAVRAQAEESPCPGKDQRAVKRIFAESSKLGDRLYESGQYEAAIKAYSTAYVCKPDPILLFNIAQARRRLRQYTEAIVTYERFLDTSPTPELREHAQRGIAEAREQMSPQPPPTASPVPPRPEMDRPKTYQVVRAPRPTWRYAVGALSVAAGLALVGLGAGSFWANGKCTTDLAFPEEHINDGMCPETYNSLGVGGALAGVGAALTIGGAVLLALPGTKQTIAVSTRAAGRGIAGHISIYF